MLIKQTKSSIALFAFCLMIFNPSFLKAASVTYHASVCGLQDNEKETLFNMGFRVGDTVTFEIIYNPSSPPNWITTSSTGSIEMYYDAVESFNVYNDYFNEDAYWSGIGQNDNHYGTSQDYFGAFGNFHPDAVRGAEMAVFSFSFQGNDSHITNSGQLLNPMPDPEQWEHANGYIEWSMPPDEVGRSDLVQVRLNNFQVVPIPATVWVFGSGLFGLFGLRKKYKI